MSIHADFPDLPEKGARSWDMPEPLGDIQIALEQGGGRADLWDIAEVTEYAIDYHGIPWSPGARGGSELGLVLVARLKDGRWLGVEEWNDYTGWGCQDGSDVYIGWTREDVIANGITNDGRSALGLELA